MGKDAGQFLFLRQVFVEPVAYQGVEHDGFILVAGVFQLCRCRHDLLAWHLVVLFGKCRILGDGSRRGVRTHGCRHGDDDDR